MSARIIGTRASVSAAPPHWPKSKHRTQSQDRSPLTHETTVAPKVALANACNCDFRSRHESLVRNANGLRLAPRGSPPPHLSSPQQQPRHRLQLLRGLNFPVAPHPANRRRTASDLRPSL